MPFKRFKNNVILNIVFAAVVLELISGVQFYYTRQLLADELEIRAESDITMKAVVIKSALNLSENSLWGHLWDLERNIASPDSLYGVMEWVLRSHKNLTGCWVAFTPDHFPEKGRLFEPYAYWSNGDIVKKQIANDHHDYSKSVYFKQVVSENTTIWINPYYDEISGLHMVSYAIPIHNNRKDVVAVFGLDVSTKMLGDTLNYGQMYESSYDLLLTKEGQLVAGPDSSRVKHSDVSNIVRIINDSTIAKNESKSGKCRIATFYDPDDHEKGYVYYASFKEKPDWQIAVVCYDDEVFGPLRQMHLTILLTTLAGLIVLGFIISYFIKNNQKLQKTSKEKARIDSELRIASSIQLEMLPSQQPTANSQEPVAIYGTLLPAREVGGDLFDYYIRDEKLFFCIGDVSGKGVPSAMLMAVTHTWFRAASTRQHNPAHIMQAINEALCEGNESNMFVTMFIGILDLPTGRLCYCNAGHDAPVILSEKLKVISDKFLTPEGMSEQSSLAAALPVNANLPVGVFSDFTYEMQETTLENGSTLFLYTDGLTEARNRQHQLFGADRMMKMLAGAADLSPQELIATTVREVQDFSNGTEQSDDLTLLAIRYLPKTFESNFSEQLTLKNDVRQVVQLSHFMKSVAERLELEPSLAKQLRLAVEEAVVNVMDYAYPKDTEGDVTIKVMSDGHWLRIQIIDSGVAFDPTAKEKTDITLSAEERQIGGLGILLVRELMDTINYERIHGQNILTLTKRLKIKN